jgi:putative ABC transport system permease protein
MDLMLKENIRQALESVRNNLLRASLTIVIIALGIMAIVGVLTTIDGIKYFFSSSFGSLGSNTFRVQNRVAQIRFGGPGQNQKRYPSITLEEAMTFKEKMGDQAIINIFANGTQAAEARFKNLKTNKNIAVYGEEETCVITSGYEIEEGRSISREDVVNGRKVAVIGQELKTKLWPNTNPIDQYFTIGGSQYRVIGMFKTKGSGIGPGSGDKFIIIPLTTCIRDFSQPNRSFSIEVYTENPAYMPVLAEQAEGVFRLVRKLRPDQENNFGINMSDSLVNQLMDNLRTLTWSATAIAVITLLGASIGLMNIMLVSVTERTREIGVRKSMGASKQNILMQFLIEAVTICQLGGLLGVLIGIFIGNIISLLLGSGFIIPWLWIIVAFVVCFIVGVASGLYPARRAAAVDPIESLRYE